MSGDPFYTSSVWRRTRLLVLRRDGERCQIRGKSCSKAADQVDHIVPISKGGSRLDPSNLRASCRNCNVARANRGRSDDTFESITQMYPGPSRAW